MLSGRLDSRRLLTLPDPNGEEQFYANRFLPLHIDSHQAKLLMTGNSLLRLLTLKVDIWRKISIEISPPIEVDYGNWLGPVLVWRGKYAISVYKDIRLWDCDELYASVNKASPHANAHYRTQKAYVFRCATAQGPFIWGINDEGQLDRFEAESGHNQNVPLIHSVTSLTSFTLEGRLVLATAVNDRTIKFLDGDTYEEVFSAIDTGVKIWDIAMHEASLAKATWLSIMSL